MEELYQERIRSMPPVEKVARSMAMFRWTRDQIARRIVQERGATEPDHLRWLVALRLYGEEADVRKLIEKELAKYVSG
jgi:hypothetical protein